MKADNIQYYFAASNSFDGFVNYFDKVFSPEKFERIFILKGGPGTGKSSFIKGILEKFKPYPISCEGILCSSDPKSFDGLIIEKDKKRIAVIDGTSPHLTDPKFPGAIEKIINLGDSWNDVLLKNNRDKIKELTNLKLYFYKNAYQYLSIAKSYTGIAYDAIVDTVSKDYINEVKSITDEVSTESGNVEIKLKTAFGMQGFFELDTFKKSKKREINVVGIYGSEYLFMESLINELNFKSANYTLSPSPLDKNKTDAVFLKSNNLYVSTNEKATSEKTTLIDTSKYIDIKKFENTRNKLETLYKEREAMLWCATDEFKKAYDAHMELEKIYIASMNFKKNIKQLDKVCGEIKDTLFPEISDTEAKQNLNI